MGRAIVRQPQAFLMDEPLSNLDAKLRVQMRAEIARLQRELGVTTIYVTHDQVEAMTMGTRVAVLDGGRIQQVDTPLRSTSDPPTSSWRLHGLAADEPLPRPVGRPTGDSPSPSDGTACRSRAGRHRARGRAWVGREVVVGIRPEAFEDASLDPGAPERVIELRVELVESLGAELLVHSAIDARQAVDGNARCSWPASRPAAASRPATPSS